MISIDRLVLAGVNGSYNLAEEEECPDETGKTVKKDDWSGIKVKRLVALAVEAKKLEYGEITYIANLFGVTHNRVHHGLKELENPSLIDQIPLVEHTTKQNKKDSRL